MWHFYLANSPKPHYAALMEILNAHAGNLAAAIDRRSQLPAAQSVKMTTSAGQVAPVDGRHDKNVGCRRRPPRVNPGNATYRWQSHNPP